MTLKRIDNIAGLPLLYDRKPASNYGKTGFVMRPYIDTDFSVEVETAFRKLLDNIRDAGFGAVKAILSGGIGRAGTGPSYHHRNRAFDLDGLVFDDGDIWVADTFPERPYFYLGVEATLRQHFGTILTYLYNSDHENHLHFDNGDSVKFVRYSKSRVLFLQNAIQLLYDIPVGIDGVYGPETEQAERRMRQDLGLGGFSDKSNWVKFLALAASEAFDREMAAIRIAGGQ
ncbi:MAG: extensin family protein [Pseudooceanicola sp.]|nr:extensin family protein [Pseudooceanicola sp.]